MPPFGCEYKYKFPGNSSQTPTIPLLADFSKTFFYASRLFDMIFLMEPVFGYLTIAYLTFMAVYAACILDFKALLD